MPTTPNNFKDRKRTATATTDKPLRKNIWHEVEYRLEMRRATNGARAEIVQGTKKLTCSLQWRDFNVYMAITFLSTNLCNCRHHL
jgi:hypothetical protein